MLPRMDGRTCADLEPQKEAEWPLMTGYAVLWLTLVGMAASWLC